MSRDLGGKSEPRPAHRAPARRPAPHRRSPRFAALTALAALVSSLGSTSCRRPEGPDPPPSRVARGRAGPEIRIRIAGAQQLRIGLPGRVRAVGLDDRQLAYQGPIPFPTSVRLRGGRLELGDQLLPARVRLVSGAVAGSPGEEPVPLGPAEVPEPATSRWDRVTPTETPVEGLRPSFLLTEHGPGDPVSRYRGVLELHAGEGEIVAVNALWLEEYLCGVVGAEMSASFPLAALRAQAVCARSYALYALREDEAVGRERAYGAHTGFQVYRGVAAEAEPVVRAVCDTRGQILTYLGRPFRTYYHSTCGGQTARAGLHFREPDIPPLEGVACGHCAGTAFSAWSTDVPADVLRIALTRRLERSGRGGVGGEIRGVEVASTGSDGRVRYLRIDTADGSVEWRADRFRLAIGALLEGAVRSTDFSVSAAGTGGYRFEGRGWGHGVGLCQVGASRMGRDAGYREILALYFPSSELSVAY